MSLFFYNIFLLFYRLGAGIYALFNAKARKWRDGRKGWGQDMAAKLKPGEQRIWIHCSSLGEFEQGRPIIESLKKHYPQYKIVLTFFSPSGYEVRKNYDQADYVFYLPLDSRSNARQFVSLLQPQLAIFVKYEFWYYYLHMLNKDKIPAILVSGAFRKGQPFFKWYNPFFRNILKCFNFLFVQDEYSRRLLKLIGFEKNVLVSGDTRYDRVSAIAKAIQPIPTIDQFCEGCKILIAGSTWHEDEQILQECLPSLPQGWKMIIAPHEIGSERIGQVRHTFGNEVVLFSQLADAKTDHRVLVIDNIGMLSALYSYGDIAYVGGGFQKGGIHNILEPAVFGIPVIFGPIYEKFVEARKLVALGDAFPVADGGQCIETVQKLIADEKFRTGIYNSLIKFMHDNTGATKTILDHIAASKWLVSDTVAVS